MLLPYILLATGVLFLTDLALWCAFVRLNDSVLTNISPGSGFYFLYRHFSNK